MEEECAECSVEEAVVDVGHEMAGFFGRIANDLVVVVEYYTDFVHESDLFGVIAG